MIQFSKTIFNFADCARCFPAEPVKCRFLSLLLTVTHLRSVCDKDAYTTIPTYPSGQIGFIICSDSTPVSIPARKHPKADQLRYYTAEVRVIATSHCGHQRPRSLHSVCVTSNLDFAACRSTRRRLCCQSLRQTPLLWARACLLSYSAWRAAACYRR